LQRAPSSDEKLELFSLTVNETLVPANAELSIDVTLFDIDIVASEVQFLNEDAPIFVTFERSTEFRDVHP
jgi:hypothetical protein